MINILIIDDADKKVERIKQIIGDFDEITSDAVFVARSQVDGKRLLCEHQFDLVILDICLPNRDGAIPQADGGVALLHEIHYRTRYKKPYCIVGLTAYPEKLEAAGELFAGHLWSIVLYEDNSDQWEGVLRDRIEYLIELKKGEALGRIFKHDLAVVTALGVPEFEAVLKLTVWEDVGGVADDTHYFTGHFADGVKRVSAVAACSPQMGMTAAAVVATKMISHFTPRYLAMTGITAGVRGQVELGDVIVADPCWDWGSGKLVPSSGGDVLEPDPLPYRLDSHMRAVFLDVQRDKDLLHRVWAKWPGQKPKQPPTLHIGPCVSGACVLANRGSVKAIQGHSRKLVGIDMEAYGLMLAGAHSALPHPLTFSMKCVSDFADERKDDSHRDYAAYVSAALLHEIALKHF